MLPETLSKFLGEHPAKVISFGIPVDVNSSHMEGASMAPWEIKKALFQDAHNSFSETGVDLSGEDVFASAGVLQYRPPTWFEDIEKSAKILAAERRFPIFIGGDHSITFPIIQGLSRTLKNLTILHIDAHPDLYDQYDYNIFSHASPFARIMEKGLVKRLVQVGIRTLTEHQREQVAKFGVECHEMKDWSGSLELEFDGPVYMTIDMDGLDPAYAPGVAHPEPGGLTSREVINLIHQAGPHLIGGDIVEFNPNCDPQGITAIVAARLVREMAGAILSNKGK